MTARRQTRGRTRRALRRLDPADRQRVTDWWMLAEQRMKTSEDDPSTPAEAVAMSVLIKMVGDAQRAVPLWIAVRAGYSLRTFVSRYASSIWPLDVSLLDRPGIVGLGDIAADDLIDSLLAGDEDIHALLDPVGSLLATYVEHRVRRGRIDRTCVLGRRPPGCDLPAPTEPRESLRRRDR